MAFTLVMGLLFLFCHSGLGQASDPSQMRFSRIGMDQGLSSGMVLTMVRDRRGFLWIGTLNGLNRYDGYQITQYFHDPENESSISDNNIKAMLEDKKGNIWIGTADGLNRYEPVTGKIHRIYFETDFRESSGADEINHMAIDEEGGFWVATQEGIRYRPEGVEDFLRITTSEGLHNNNVFFLLPDGRGIWIAAADGRVQYYTHQDKSWKSFRVLEDDQWERALQGYTGMVKDYRGLLWIATDGGGLIRLNPLNGKFIQYLHTPNGAGIAHNRLWCMVPDPIDQRLIWIGGGNGLNLLNLENDSFTLYRNHPAVNSSLGNNWVTTLLTDTRDTSPLLWVGTGDGINRYDYSQTRFEYITADPSSSDSLPGSEIWAFYKDRNSDRLWVGGSLGLYCLDSNYKLLHFYKMDPLDPEGKATNEVWNIAPDDRNRLWYGTSHGLTWINPDTGEAHFFSHDPSNPKGLSSNFVWAMKWDPNYGLWIGTNGTGLDLMDPDSLEVTNYHHESANVHTLSEDHIWSLAPGRQRTLWVGTNRGLNLLDPASGKVSRITEAQRGRSSLSEQRVWAIHPAPNGIVWLGTTRAGLTRLDPTTGKITYVTQKDGLRCEVVYSILSDQIGRIWLGTNRGLICYDESNASFLHFDRTDGIQGSEFNEGAVFVEPGGRMYFGGNNGFNVFYPERLQASPITPSVTLTELRLANNLVQPDFLQPFSPLHAPIELTEKLDLSFKQNAFSLQFSTLDLTNPTRNHYAYMLEGLDMDWITVDAQTRMATYTNLNNGDYTFKVKATNRDGVWNMRPTELAIHIFPPAWKTWWAISLYFLLGTALLLSLFLAQRHKLKAERSLNLQFKQLVRLKDEFLANTSHELRTPLHGIIGMVEAILAEGDGSMQPKTRQNLNLVLNGARRLANLVNDILDFSRLRREDITLRLEAVDLRVLADVVLTLCRPLAEKKDLTLINQVPDQLPPVFADEDRLQQVLYNLVGNAVKFTPKGSVTVSASRTDDLVTIEVHDTGIGISQELHDSIFNAFQQGSGDVAREYGGTGLGLAISHDLVRLHGGKLELESKPDLGSTFYFSLPLASPDFVVSKEQNTDLEVFGTQFDDDEENLESVSQADLAQLREPNADQFTILVVDDELLNRNVLLNHLDLAGYRLLQAGDGQRALEMVQEGHQIDLILMDLMMPKMSGFETTRLIRHLYSFKELPILLLTARNRVSNLVTGFAVGINDYMVKPVSRDELLTRVKAHLNVLDIHRNLEKKVDERTRELEQRNQELAERSQTIDRARKQLALKEKMASLGSLSAGIAHEIRNPLNFINNFSLIGVRLVEDLKEILERDGNCPPSTLKEIGELMADMVDNARCITDHGQKAARIVESMIAITPNNLDLPRNSEINNLIEKYSRIAATVMATRTGKEIPIRFHFDENLGLSVVRPREFCQAIVQLVNNALEATLEKVSLADADYHPRIVVKTLAYANSFEIKVRDNGIGIPDEIRELLFTPFHTTKSQNTGLGLAACYSIITEQHNGSISFDSRPGEFTEVTLTIPFEQEPA